jgi:hypothetical protein
MSRTLSVLRRCVFTSASFWRVDRETYQRGGQRARRRGRYPFLQGTTTLLDGERYPFVEGRSPFVEGTLKTTPSINQKEVVPFYQTG